MQPLNIDTLLWYERYIPVLTDEEQKGLLERRPTLMQVQEWEKRLSGRTSDIEGIFSRAYNKSIKKDGKRTR